jgi:glucose/arabinose dehydrogenase
MIRFVRLVAVAVLVAAVAAACSFPPAEPGAPGLVTLDDWVRGRNKIWDIAFPQGWLPAVYTENDSGVIFTRWSNADTGRPLGAVTQFDSFDPSGEGGLMGIALSPGFNASTDRKVFVCYSTPFDNRVAKFDLDLLGPSFTAISNWQVIVSGLPHANIHNGCRVRFQPGTGALFVSTGDGASGPSPQSDTVLGGKILRIDVNGNPWPGNASGARWYTKGHRNPQGLAFRPGSNDPYSVEHGPDRNDEVNKLFNGANAGWNPTNGTDYDQTKAMTEPAIATLFPLWSTGPVTVAPSGATFLSGAQWKGWNGMLIVACLDGSPSVGQRLLAISLNAAGTGLNRPPVTALARGVRLRSAVQGPDGNLYVVTDGNNGAGAVWKVVPN